MNNEREEMLKKLQNVEAMEKENLEGNGLEDKVEIDDVKYLGKVTLVQETEGEKEEIEINVYTVIEGKTIKYYSDDMCLGIETTDVGNGEPAIIPSPEYLRMYEKDNPIKDIINNLKLKEIEEQENQQGKRTTISLKELEAKQKKAEYAEVLEEDEKNIKSVAEIRKDEDTKKLEKMNHLQEIDANTEVNNYKDMEKALKLVGVRKFVIVYSEDAAKLSETREQNSSRYSMIAVMDDGSMLNLDDRLERVPSEGKNSVEGRIQTDADEKTRIENNPASIYQIKGSDSNEAFSFEQGQYGEIKAYYGNMTGAEGTKFVGTQIETQNVWPTSKELKEQASDRKGKYYADDKTRETQKHINNHGEEEIDIKDSDGDTTTFKCIEQDWKELATKWGYYKDGKPDEEKAKRIYEEYKYNNPHLSDEEVVQEVSDDLYDQIPGRNLNR